MELKKLYYAFNNGVFDAWTQEREATPKYYILSAKRVEEIREYAERYGYTLVLGNL